MSRHLFKMLLGLVGMALFGIIGLFVINLYHKQGNVESSASLPQAINSGCVTGC